MFEGTIASLTPTVCGLFGVQPPALVDEPKTDTTASLRAPAASFESPPIVTISLSSLKCAPRQPLARSRVQTIGGSASDVSSAERGPSSFAALSSGAASLVVAGGVAFGCAGAVGAAGAVDRGGVAGVFCAETVPPNSPSVAMTPKIRPRNGQ